MRRGFKTRVRTEEDNLKIILSTDTRPLSPGKTIQVVRHADWTGYMGYIHRAVGVVVKSTAQPDQQKILMWQIRLTCCILMQLYLMGNSEVDRKAFSSYNHIERSMVPRW